MPRPPKERAEQATGHQISFPPELWRDFNALLRRDENGRRLETAAGVIQELVREWITKRRLQQLADKAPDLLRQVEDREG